MVAMQVAQSGVLDLGGKVICEKCLRPSDMKNRTLRLGLTFGPFPFFHKEKMAHKQIHSFVIAIPVCKGMPIQSK